MFLRKAGLLTPKHKDGKNYQASMAHISIPREEMIKHGLSVGLSRLSVGIEVVDDLIGDLETAIG